MDKELEELRRKVRQLTLRNAQLQSQHDFAMSSWQTAVKRAGMLSAELEELRGKVVPLEPKTTVAPYTPILKLRGRRHLA